MRNGYKNGNQFDFENVADYIRLISSICLVFVVVVFG